MSGIQSIQSRFKLIKFNDDIKKQIDEPVNKKNIMAYRGDIPVDENNNCFLFKINIEYV